jgi:hypothetical protein
MGASGYGPFDNDGAGDWLTTLRGPVSRGLRSKHPDYAFAALDLLHTLHATYIVPKEDIIKAAHTVQAADVSAWRSPSTRKKAIRKVLADLEKETGLQLLDGFSPTQQAYRRPSRR